MRSAGMSLYRMPPLIFSFVFYCLEYFCSRFAPVPLPVRYSRSAAYMYTYMLVPKCALANWDPSLRTGIYLSQFGNWDHRHNLSLQTGIDREIMNI